MSNQSTLLLEHHLKELKLPTFLREYRKLAAQCAAEGTDHPDYLLRHRAARLPAKSPVVHHHPVFLGRCLDHRQEASYTPVFPGL